MAKSREWLDKVDEFIGDLAGEIDEVKASEAYRKHLDVMSTFWHYSFSNQMLIALQCPEATMVAGFRQWKKKGRYVKKGEKAIYILAPGIKKVDDEEDGYVVQYFFPVSVFDISQTEGEALPLMSSRVEGGDARPYLDALIAHCELNGTRVKYESLREGAYGYSRNGEIILNGDHPANTLFGTAIHEMAHEMLHWDGTKETKIMRETEAEGVSYVVLRHFGLKTSAPTYLALYQSDEGALKRGFGNISDVAKQIIAAVESRLSASIAA